MGVRRPVTRYLDRVDAGWRLGERLRHLGGENVVVLGLPRGGVPVAAGVAHALHAPLDVIIVRKLGVPHQPEFAMGALGEGGVRILNDEVVTMTGVTPQELAAIEERERAELERRGRRFRAGRPPVPIAGRTVVVVDDGIATGSTARAACRVARARGAARIILAVPAAINGDAAMVNVLIKAGADPNTANAEGETVLMTAARTGSAEALDVLLRHGAAVNAKESWLGETALMWAVSQQHADVVHCLGAAGRARL